MDDAVFYPIDAGGRYRKKDVFSYQRNHSAREMPDISTGHYIIPMFAIHHKDDEKKMKRRGKEDETLCHSAILYLAFGVCDRYAPTSPHANNCSRTSHTPTSGWHGVCASGSV
jgi:hypothetical protein